MLIVDIRDLAMPFEPQVSIAQFKRIKDKPEQLETTLSSIKGFDALPFCDLSQLILNAIKSGNVHATITLCKHPSFNEKKAFNDNSLFGRTNNMSVLYHAVRLEKYTIVDALIEQGICHWFVPFDPHRSPLKLLNLYDGKLEYYIEHFLGLGEAYKLCKATVRHVDIINDIQPVSKTCVKSVCEFNAITLNDLYCVYRSNLNRFIDWNNDDSNNALLISDTISQFDDYWVADVQSRAKLKKNKANVFFRDLIKGKNKNAISFVQPMINSLVEFFINNAHQYSTNEKMLKGMRFIFRLLVWKLIGNIKPRERVKLLVESIESSYDSVAYRHKIVVLKELIRAEKPRDLIMQARSVDELKIILDALGISPVEVISNNEHKLTPRMHNLFLELMGRYI